MGVGVAILGSSGGGLAIVPVSGFVAGDGVRWVFGVWPLTVLRSDRLRSESRSGPKLQVVGLGITDLMMVLAWLKSWVDSPLALT